MNDGKATDHLAIIGLGYVGLPLAVAFGRLLPTIGFDCDGARVDELLKGSDHTQEVTSTDLEEAIFLKLTSDETELQNANIYIVSVPTPIDDTNRPDFRPLVNASITVGRNLKDGDLVIFESTVYPGATEEICVPLLAEASGLEYNVQFSVGYSPERINPGDREHNLANIVKITSGSSTMAADLVDRLYRMIVTAGTHRAESIKVAEAAKVIENVQRDVNIALINELAVLFNKLDIDTHAVLEAAGTKWNFLPFKPGLVGGHCIGVDPYYLTHRAQQVGHHPEVMLAGRRINDSMGSYVAEQVVLSMAKKGVPLNGARILIMGFTFKENCPDTRNTKVKDVIERLIEFGAKPEIYDPWVESAPGRHEAPQGLVSIEQVMQTAYSAIVLAVAHTRFQEDFKIIRPRLTNPGVVFDVKGVLPKEEEVDGCL